MCRYGYIGYMILIKAGIRASNYNAIPEAGVQQLISYLKEFATTA